MVLRATRSWTFTYDLTFKFCRARVWPNAARNTSGHCYDREARARRLHCWCFATRSTDIVSLSLKGCYVPVHTRSYHAYFASITPPQAATVPKISAAHCSGSDHGDFISRAFHRVIFDIIKNYISDVVRVARPKRFDGAQK